MNSFSNKKPKTRKGSAGGAGKGKFPPNVGPDETHADVEDHLKDYNQANKEMEEKWRSYRQRHGPTPQPNDE